MIQSQHIASTAGGKHRIRQSLGDPAQGGDRHAAEGIQPNDVGIGLPGWDGGYLTIARYRGDVRKLS